MRLVTFAHAGRIRLGLVRDDGILDLAEASQGRLPSDMRTFLEQGPVALATAKELEVSGRPSFSFSDVTLLAPVPNPSKIIAIGLNYMDHCREQGHPVPEMPVIFAKFPSAVIGPGEAIRWDPTLTQQVDYEIELAVVIGKTARRVPAERAFEYVAGYTICNDVSARDLQFGDKQWVRGKSLDTFCPLGPWLVTRDAIPDPHQLRMRTVLNGRVMQDSTTAEMIFRIPELIEFASRAFTLLPGDIIATGTPHGVGVFRNPPVFLKDGDVITLKIERIGVLSNPCVEERGT